MIFQIWVASILLCVIIPIATNGDHLRAQTRNPNVQKMQELSKRFGVETFGDVQMIEANPYQWAAKPVALVVRFVRMTSPTTAIFRDFPPGNSIAFVSKVPTTAFSAEQDVILVVKVVGVQENLNLPHVELLGFDLCKEKACRDFGW